MKRTKAAVASRAALNGTRTDRITLDVTWDPADEDHPATWQWDHGYDPRPAGSIVVTDAHAAERES